MSRATITSPARVREIVTDDMLEAAARAAARDTHHWHSDAFMLFAMLADTAGDRIDRCAVDALFDRIDEWLTNNTVTAAAS